MKRRDFIKRMTSAALAMGLFGLKLPKTEAGLVFKKVGPVDVYVSDFGSLDLGDMSYTVDPVGTLSIPVLT